MGGAAQFEPSVNLGSLLASSMSEVAMLTTCCAALRSSTSK